MPAKKPVKKAPKAKAAAKAKSGKITKDMTFMEVFEKNPDAAEVFMRHGMHCLGCAAAHFETVGQGAEAHGIDVDSLIKDLNAIKKKK